MPIEPVSGYKIENGSLGFSNEICEDENIFNGLIESHKDIPYYQSFYFGRRLYFYFPLYFLLLIFRFFFQKAHSNYIVEDPEKGIFFISIIGENAVKEVKKFGTIVRYDGGTDVIPRSRKKKIIQSYNINPNTPWKEIKDPDFNNAIRNLETKDLQVRRRYKVALLYAKEGQNQNEMFSNSK